MHRALLVAGLLGSWTAGCANPTLPFEDLDDTALRSRCERFVRCGAVADQESCEAFFRKRVDRDLAAAVGAGKIRYDGELAKLCYDTLAAMTCDDSARTARIPPQSCARIFAGTLEVGASCELDRECTTNRCEPIAPPCGIGECCPGTCVDVVLAAIDEPCATTRDCAADTYCGQELVCRPLGVEDAPCLIDAQCDYGLVCDTATFPGACVVPGQLGEPCPDARCAEVGARCSAGMCVATGLPGDPCTTTADCSSFAECDDATMRCIATPTVGDSCRSACAGEAWCDLTARPPGTCRVPGADGEPCKADNECISLYCAEGPIFDFCDPLAVCF